MVDITRLYSDIPVVTRTYLTLCVLTTLACYMELISPLKLYFNTHLIFKKYQIWRLLTNFFFFFIIIWIGFIFSYVFLVSMSTLYIIYILYIYMFIYVFVLEVGIAGD